MRRLGRPSLGNRVRSPLTIFHLHTGGEECFPRPRAIHFCAKLSRGDVAIKRSVFPVASSPSPRYLRNLSRDHPLDDLHSPSPCQPPLPSCHRCRLARATAPSPPCRIQMSLFSGPLQSPFTQPCAVTGEAGGEKKITRMSAARRRWWRREVGAVSGLDKSPVDRYACSNERASLLSSCWLLEEPRLFATR